MKLGFQPLEWLVGFLVSDIYRGNIPEPETSSFKWMEMVKHHIFHVNTIEIIQLKLPKKKRWVVFFTGTLKGKQKSSSLFLFGGSVCFSFKKLELTYESVYHSIRIRFTGFFSHNCLDVQGRKLGSKVIGSVGYNPKLYPIYKYR